MILINISTIKIYILVELWNKNFLKMISKLKKYDATPNAKKGAAIDK
jgi:hypothetical protein